MHCQVCQCSHHCHNHSYQSYRQLRSANVVVASRTANLTWGQQMVLDRAAQKLHVVDFAEHDGKLFGSTLSW